MKNIIKKSLLILGMLSFSAISFSARKVYVKREPSRIISTHRVDHIYFRFKGRAFKRPFSLTDYDLSDICNRYDVELYLKEPLPTVYYISGISLCKKENVSK